MRYLHAALGLAMLLTVRSSQGGMSSHFVCPDFQDLDWSGISGPADARLVLVQVTGGKPTTLGSGVGSIANGSLTLNTPVGTTTTFDLYVMTDTSTNVATIWSAERSRFLQGTLDRHDSVQVAGADLDPSGIAGCTIAKGKTLSITGYSSSGGAPITFQCAGSLILSKCESAELNVYGQTGGDNRCQLADCKLSYINMGTMTADIKNCIVEGTVSLGTSPTGDLPMASVNFAGGFANAFGALAQGDITIDDSEFYGMTTLSTSGKVKVTGSIIRQELYLAGTPSEYTLKGNDFLSYIGLFTQNDGPPVSLDGNFWGSVKGPMGGGLPSQWVNLYGASCSRYKKSSYITSPLCKPKDVPFKRSFPAVWLENGPHAGQNVLGLLPDYQNQRRGRDIKVCYDVRVADYQLDSVSFWLDVSGTRLQPETPFVLRRAIRGLPTDTLNFRIDKALTEGVTSLHLSLYMDTSKVTGHYAFQGAGGDGVVKFNEVDLIVQPAPARPLRIGFVDVANYNGGFKTNVASGAARTVMNQLDRELPGLFPLTTKDYELVDLGTYPFTTGWNVVRGAYAYASADGLTAAIAADLNVFLSEYNASVPVALDFLVGVVPAGTMGTDSGRTSPRWPSILLVNEATPWAAIHELGHGLGLYVKTDEQYDLPDGPDTYGNLISNNQGAQMRGNTLFTPEPLRGVIGSFSGSVFMHLPTAEFTTFYDIMGKEPEHWILPSTLKQVYDGLYAVVGKKPVTAPLSHASVANQAQLRPTTATKTLLFRGWLKPFYDPTYQGVYYHLLPNSVTCEDVTGRMRASIGGSVGILATLNIYDPFGGRLPLNLSLTGPHGARASDTAIPWVQTFTLPEGLYGGYVITNWTGEFVTELKPTNPSGWLSGLANGAKVGDALTLSVSDFGTPGVHNRLLYTQDNLTWKPLGGGVPAGDFQFSTRGMTNLTAVKLVSSDGFASKEMTFTGLSLTARSPTAHILSPSELRTSTNVTLRAEASDPSDGTLVSGRWASSLDGFLGNGVELQASLRPGQHTLTFIVTNSASLTAQDARQILVLDPGRVRITTAKVVPEGQDPLRADYWPEKGRTNWLFATLANNLTTNQAVFSLILDGATNATVTLDWESGEKRDIALPAFFARNVQLPSIHLALQASDTNGNTWTDQMDLTFTNRPPVAPALQAAVRPGDTVILRLAGYDPSGDDVTFQVGKPSLGQPSPRFPELAYLAGTKVGVDHFTYTVSNGSQSATGSIDVSIEAAAAAQPQQISIWTNQVVTIPVASQNYQAFNLPAWLLFANNQLQGTPPAAGLFLFDLAALGSVTSYVVEVVSPLPQITSPAEASGSAGQPFSYAITLSVPAVVGTRYEAIGLPEGLTLDGQGLISGTPAYGGTNTVQIAALTTQGTAYGQLTLSISGQPKPTASAFQEWAASLGLTGNDAQPDADPGHLGLGNLARFALGWTPTNTVQNLLPFGAQTDPDAYYVYRQRKGGVGQPGVDYTVDHITYLVDVADSLEGPWTSGSGAIAFSSKWDNNDDTETVLMRVTQPGKNRFVRLRLRVQ